MINKYKKGVKNALSDFHMSDAMSIGNNYSEEMQALESALANRAIDLQEIPGANKAPMVPPVDRSKKPGAQQRAAAIVAEESW